MNELRVVDYWNGLNHMGHRTYVISPNSFWFPPMFSGNYEDWLWSKLETEGPILTEMEKIVHMLMDDSKEPVNLIYMEKADLENIEVIKKIVLLAAGQK